MVCVHENIDNVDFIIDENNVRYMNDNKRIYEHLVNVNDRRITDLLDQKKSKYKNQNLINLIDLKFTNNAASINFDSNDDMNCCDVVLQYNEVIDIDKDNNDRKNYTVTVNDPHNNGTILFILNVDEIKKQNVIIDDLLKIASNKYLELEMLLNKDVNSSQDQDSIDKNLESQQDANNTRKKSRKKKRKLNNSISNNPLKIVSNFYKDFLLQNSKLKYSKDFKYWEISFSLLLISSKSQFNKFSNETVRILDRLYSNHLKEKDINNRVVDLNSNFIQKLFNHRTTSYTKQRLKDLKLEFYSKIEGLNDITLLPFQMETIQWMLEKEKKMFESTFDSNIGIFRLNEFLNFNVSYGYEIMKLKISDESSTSLDRKNLLFWNKFTNYILPYQEAMEIYENAHKVPENYGARGLISEEMGLGKTIEVLSVLLLNKRDLPTPIADNRTSLYFTSNDFKRIRKAKTTLICCPNAILQQWINEINSHISDVTVFYYKGYHHMKEVFNIDDIDEIVENLSKYDIIITTYNTVSVEVHYAEYNSNLRKRRNAEVPKYNYSSPISLIQFHRIILDEVQMLRSDSTNVAKCTSLLHRVHTWGVSGTPIHIIPDIHTVLSYLQIHPFKDIPKIVSSINLSVLDVTKRQNMTEISRENELLKSSIDGVSFNINNLLDIFQIFDLCIRHTKHDVKSQINIPEQYNYIIPLEFSPVEWDNYLDVWNTFIRMSGYNSDGSGRTRLSTIELNQYLTKLRYLCCHAILPDSHNKLSKNNKSNPNLVYNMDDILKIMTMEAKDKLDSLYRENYQLKIKGAQAKMELQNNPKAAIDYLLEIKDKLISDLSSKCNVSDPFNVILDSIANSENTETVNEMEPGNIITEKGKVDDNLRLKAYMDLLHQCLFFIANGYYFLGSHRLEKVDDENEKIKLLHLESDNDTKAELKLLKYTDVYNENEMKVIESNQILEQKYYELADLLRKQILSSRIEKVNETIIDVKSYFQSKSKAHILNLKLIEFNFKDDFSNSLIVSKVFKLLGLLISSLNEQTIQFNDLVQELLTLSYNPLSKTYDGEDSEEVRNEKSKEYADSIDFQDKVFGIFSCLERILQNRSAIMTSEDDIKLPKKLNLMGQNLSEYHLDLLKNLKLVQGTPFKPIFDELKNLRVVKGSNVPLDNAKVSSSTFEDYLLSFEGHINGYKKEIKDMKESLKMINSIYNSKVEYYSHLQSISDSLVSLLQLEPHQRSNIVRAIKNDNQYKINLKQIMTTGSRLKYLDSLTTLQESIEQNKTFTCPICLGLIHTGSMISCGHFFCNNCIFSWLKLNSNCPLCKRDTTQSQLYNFKFKNEITEESTNNEELSDIRAPQKPNHPNIESNIDIFIEKYKEFPKLSDVHNIVIKTSFGAKIDFTVKLILYLKLKAANENDREPQILMYSQSMEFLKVISHVLKLHDIKQLSCLSNTSNVGQTISNFKQDPSITCLLLNIKSLGAGLNLLNARHIILLDPIINHGDELQAKSRNNRIGQAQTTFVWNLMIKNSVEENILKYKCKLENKKKIVKKSMNIDLDDELSSNEEQKFELNEGTGEVVSKNHLWNCLFQGN
ncbi:hypothetical protein TPHA_0B03650 [Tetrapisispora phaffii CBS 4417]|uniref:RING-type domain-containing protein n=1 Tax=Tetrapisispora phaffii (strain ATCC 24235 / CBS 4417 / NBRC 1672 / NRRL Y-8282 / UCD 70-5) TaxID=1071381 RepID=G8BPV6_TETPH|nr:hypothetical protein TPHA_0B03650 [Tetrapisispora phaffii CBS 4417]CCE62037.1 hypothetical protein TPHA_0B03650 [Tetrapisispora phaffii CBS 4417]